MTQFSMIRDRWDNQWSSERGRSFMP